MKTLGREDYAEAAATAVRNCTTMPPGAENHPPIEANGVRFDVLEVGGSRAALTAPDGVIYRANLGTMELEHPPVPGEPHGALVPSRSFDRELALYNALQDHEVARRWCPEHQAFPEHAVMAVRRYERTAAPTDDPLALHHLGDKIEDAAFGTDDTGRVVLLGACNVTFNPDPA